MKLLQPTKKTVKPVPQLLVKKSSRYSGSTTVFKYMLYSISSDVFALNHNLGGDEDEQRNHLNVGRVRKRCDIFFLVELFF